jgi:signal transduction histidine kinase
MSRKATARVRPRLSIRARFTLVQCGLALLACVLLLGITYFLISYQLTEGTVLHPMQSEQGAGTPSDTAVPTTAVPDGSPGAPRAPAPADVVNAQAAALNALLTQGGIALGAAAVAATVLAWLIAGRLLRPLHRITETATRIAKAPAADRGLHERIALDGPDDELKHLADTFDVMLARLDQSFDGQRRFIANASHELRTPLGLNQALLEVVLQRPGTTSEMRQVGETLLDINARHERLIDGLLLLARAEREVEERSYVDLSDIVEHVADHTPRGAVELVTKAGEAPTTGNLVLLERLLQNLVENAIRYNIPAGGWVHIGSDTAVDGSARLRVSNTGPVVPRFDVPSLFEPFRRLGAERIRAPGAGLGLSIVRAVARAHGGEVQAEPRDGGGLIVTVTLPPA